MKIKGFDKDLKCRGFQFEIGKEYKIDVKKEDMRLCTNTVFHYCDSLHNVHKFYNVLKNNRFCEIEVLGEEITDGEKYGSNHIKIVREIKGGELNILKGLINGNTGLFNSGNRNSGNCNSGNWNSGDGNSGNCNSGNCNSGDWNSGNGNSGNWNSGDWNSGNWNSGYRNSGNCNSGNWNSCNYSSGIFCSKEEKIRLFNKQSNLTMGEFRCSKYYDALFSSPFILTEWVEYTEEEKKESLCRQAIGGYLKTYTYKEACKNWWDSMSEENKEIVKSIPNFDKDVFFEITGIEVE